jgi:hypothetical protein
MVGTRWLRLDMTPTGKYYNLMSVPAIVLMVAALVALLFKQQGP